jgi:hypothetical protein
MHIKLHLFTVLQHFVVVEFTHKSDVDHILNVSSHINKKEVIPVRSPFLWFRAPKTDLQPKHSLSQPSTLVEVDGNNLPTAAELRSWMQGAESVSHEPHFNSSPSEHMGQNDLILL